MIGAAAPNDSIEHQRNASIVQNTAPKREPPSGVQTSFATKQQINKDRRRLFDHRSAKKQRDPHARDEAGLFKAQGAASEQRADGKVIEIDHLDDITDRLDESRQSRRELDHLAAAEITSPLKERRPPNAQN